jgi:transposase
MHSTTVAVDLAKSVFELAIADAEGKITERLRLNRSRFSAFFVQRPSCRVLMEACGSAHYWARCIARHGHSVELLPAQYVRRYVRRSKTDRADAAALIEAARCDEIRAVPVEFGVVIPLGARVARSRIAQHLAQPSQEVPAALQPLMIQMLSDLDQLQQHILEVERADRRQCSS